MTPGSQLEELTQGLKHRGTKAIQDAPSETNVSPWQAVPHSSADLQESSALLKVDSWAAALMVLEVPSDLVYDPSHALTLPWCFVFYLHKFYLLMGERCRQFKESLAILTFRQCLILSWHIILYMYMCFPIHIYPFKI